MKSSEYIENLNKILTEAYEGQRDTMSKASEVLADCIANKNNIYMFGCSHAGIISEELFYRTGGLALINPIFFPALMLNTKPVTMTTKLERLPGLGKIIVEENKLAKGDVLLVHSVSGRNTVPVEVALEARKIGVYVIGLTNLTYSRAVTSRHDSGKKLYEVCDLVIDNFGDIGDSSVSIKGLPEKIGPTSTVIGTALVNALVIDVVELLITRGIVPPVFLSANLDGGDEHNKKIFDEYKDNIFYM